MKNQINEVHESALAVLTHDWQSLPELRKAASKFNHLFKSVSGFGPNSGTWGFSDLVEYGLAEAQHVPVMDGNIQRGSHLFYRLSSKHA